MAQLFRLSRGKKGEWNGTGLDQRQLTPDHIMVFFIYGNHVLIYFTDRTRPVSSGHIICDFWLFIFMNVNSN